MSVMRVVLVLFTLLLSGCGYRGALYLPEEQTQNISTSPVPEDDATTSEEKGTSPATDSSGDQN